MQSIRSLFVLCAVAIGFAQACTPNFEGAPILVKAGDGSNLLPNPPTQPGPWHIQQDGQANPGYLFRDANNNNRMLTRNPDNTVSMGPAADSGNDPRQVYHLQCQMCVPGAATAAPGTIVASLCSIAATDPTTSLCVNSAGASPSTSFGLVGCARVSAGGVFSFSKA
ncbi:hypothetical protein V5O48_007074 [Marasmius crinis-equi]|uniref:Uncharacterized protein n=1 Tax=Marasmius crinis-equi TaxID=585013 RepID=A0ABR3FHP5_9AGAR